MDGPNRPSVSQCQYQYTPLADQDEIRLLHLQPGSECDNVECSLHSVRLSDNPEYVALSYMWGPESSNPVNISGSRYNVRENLWQALRHIRHKTKITVFWADAICIDQQNILERNHQVAQMGKIYSQAERVVAWLGLETDEIPLDLEMLQHYDCANGALDGLSSAHHTNIASQPLLSEVAWGTRFLCEREYWSRLWIIQELLLAKHVTFQCGRASFTILQLSMLLDNLESYLNTENSSFYKPQFKLLGLRNIYTSSKYPVYSVDRVSNSNAPDILISGILHSIPAKLCYNYNFIRMPSVTASDGPRTLLSLCTEYEDSNCADPRDRIFAIMNLASPCCKNATDIDYSVSMAQLSSAVMAHYLLRHSIGSSKAQIPQLDLYLYHELQALLGISAEDYICIPESPHHIDTVRIPAWVSGRFTYVSPPLNYGKNYGYPAAMTAPTEIPLPISCWLDSLAIRIRFGPSDSPKRMTLAAEDRVFTLHGTFTELPYDTSAVKSTPSAKWKYSSPPNMYRIPVNQRDNWYFKQPSDMSREYNRDELRKLLDRCCEEAQHAGLPNCKLAFSDSGQIYLVPENTEINDLLCNFGNCEVWAIVRSSPNNEGTNGIVLGRAERSRELDRINGTTIKPYEQQTFIERLAKRNEPKTGKPIELTLDMHSFHLMAAFARRHSDDSRT